MNNKYKYHGMWPVAPTPFHESGEVDYEGMDRVIDCMVDQKVEGISCVSEPEIFCLRSQVA